MDSNKVHPDSPDVQQNPPELLPCPFCGKKALAELSKVQYDQLHGEPYQNTIIRCAAYCARIDASCLDLAAKKWNRRAAPSHEALTAEVASAKKLASEYKTDYEESVKASSEVLKILEEERTNVLSLTAEVAALRSTLATEREMATQDARDQDREIAALKVTGQEREAHYAGMRDALELSYQALGGPAGVYPNLSPAMIKALDAARVALASTSKEEG